MPGRGFPGNLGGDLPRHLDRVLPGHLEGVLSGHLGRIGFCPGTCICMDQKAA